MNLGEVLFDEHMDQPVPLEGKVLKKMSLPECDDDVKHDKKSVEDDELDLIVFRCRD